MITIHKYALYEAEDTATTYEGVKWLHVANQDEKITVWAEVDTDASPCVRSLYVVSTGHTVPEAATNYLGSALMAGGSFVFHVYSGDAA